MNHNDTPLRFSIKNEKLYLNSEEYGFREVTHIERLDGGGADYLDLWVSGQNISAGFSDKNPSFTLTRSWW
ncbi:MAG: hypothetical protein HOI46_07210 [Rhodospirillaceae bacterium]|nr:hypothetical protein [Rhodospirillaceae bacterium]